MIRPLLFVIHFLPKVILRHRRGRRPKRTSRALRNKITAVISMFREFSKLGSFRLFYSGVTNTSHDHSPRTCFKISPHASFFPFVFYLAARLPGFSSSIVAASAGRSSFYQRPRRAEKNWQVGQGRHCPLEVRPCTGSLYSTKKPTADLTPSHLHDTFTNSRLDTFTTPSQQPLRMDSGMSGHKTPISKLVDLGKSDTKTQNPKLINSIFAPYVYIFVPRILPHRCRL